MMGDYENFWEMEPLMQFISYYFKFRNDGIRVRLDFAIGKNGKRHMKSVTIENKEI